MNSILHFGNPSMLYKSYYKAHSQNRLRFKPISENGDFALMIIQLVLIDNPMHPLNPIPDILYHFKFSIKPFSTIYAQNLKRKRKKG